MKFIKGALVFFVYPAVMLAIGFFAGIEAVEFFYPGRVQQELEGGVQQSGFGEQALLDSPREDINSPEESDLQNQQEESLAETAFRDIAQETVQGTGKDFQGLQEVSSSEETLSVDTEYVLEETDIVNNTVVETSWKLPDKYVGMNREQFLAAMESYAAFPPLSELERGFVGLEVLSFSRERVVIQMNYQYLQPSSSFYLAVLNNEVVVYLEDMETIYINTGIELESLPEDLQMDIIQMLWVKDEESLYNFLETYSS